MPVRYDGSTVTVYEKTSNLTLIGDTLTQCDPFGIPSTSHWTGAAIIVQCPRTKTCIVTRPRTSRRPMRSSLAGSYEMVEAAFRQPARTGVRPDWMADWMEPFARTIDALRSTSCRAPWTGVDWN